MLEVVVNQLKVIVEATVLPEESKLDGFMEPFNLAVLLWPMGLIDDNFNADRAAESGYLISAPIVYSDSFDFVRYCPDQIFDEMDSIFRGFSGVHLASHMAGAIINSVKAAELPAPAKRITSVQLQFFSRCFQAIQMRRLLLWFNVFPAIADAVAAQDSKNS